MSTHTEPSTPRALAEKGLPYTHLERHTAVGGIWDIDNPGTPMYDSAHFISSRTQSGFGGFPMPEWYADYIIAEQTGHDPRDFAGLFELGVAVRLVCARLYEASTQPADAGGGGR